jgi:hypothetical protein
MDALAPIDPNKTTNDGLNWFATHGGLIIGAIVCTIVVVALFRALPKWLFGIIALAVLAILVGVKVR